MERCLQIAERVIALVRPKFYNRLTWVVVLAGLILMSSPWWLDLMNALAKRHLGLTLPPYESHLAWGLALVAMGMVYHIAVHYISELITTQREATTLASHREHDRNVFEALVTQLSENDLASILGDLQDQHAYVSPQSTKLDRAVQHLFAPSTQFIHTQVSAAAKTFGLSLRDLRNWTSLNFFVYGPAVDGVLRFCLYPDLNEDRSSRFPTAEESKRYDGFANELYIKVDDVHKTYGFFRSTVKTVLAV